jgi:RES domain-containing protein
VPSKPTIRAWRICKPKHAKPPCAAFSGIGARLYGGRWNSKGVAVVYLGGSLALAALELLVHLESDHLLSRYVAIPVDIPADQLEDVDRSLMPKSWRTYPAPRILAKLGDAWVASGSSLAMRVPSAVVPMESNILLNPTHPAMSRVVIGKPAPFRFDERLLKTEE